MVVQGLAKPPGQSNVPCRFDPGTLGIVKLGLNHGWMSCHSSKKSYPEKFFTQVIENEFDDKNYEYNLLFYQYRLDFAWPHKKLCIEINGSQ